MAGTPAAGRGWGCVIDPVPQPVDLLERNSENLSEHSLQSKETKKTNGVQF